MLGCTNYAFKIACYALQNQVETQQFYIYNSQYIYIYIHTIYIYIQYI